MIFVDDASRDGTLAALMALKAELPRLRVLAHQKNSGQSRAVRSGAEAARGQVLVTLDGDGQNDPADAPRLVERLKAGGPGLGLVGGLRLKRQDSWSKKVGSKIGNGVRRRLLRDDALDTGCGLKAMWLSAYLRFPYFDHMHRFLPALTKREGLRTDFVEVAHRPRVSGQSKYTNWRRLKASLGDLIGVVWLLNRGRLPGGVQER